MCDAVEVRLVLALAILSGCDVVFGLERNEEGEQSERPAFCDLALFDDFETNGLACVWGVTFEEGVSQHDSVLEVRLTGTRPVFAGCTAFRGYALTERGVFLKISSPLRVDTAYTALGVRGMTQGTSSFKLAFDGSTDFYVNNVLKGSRDGEPLPWWRIRHEGANVIAEVSADAMTWETIANKPTTIPPTVAIDIGAGINAASSPGSATFDTFGICN